MSYTLEALLSGSWEASVRIFEKADAETAALRAENARLREDKERWDFVERHPEIGFGSSRPHKRIVGFSPCKENGWNTTLQFADVTYRAAIDRARAALEKEEKQ